MPPFTVKLDDPTGNSFIEFVDSMADPKWNLRTYRRTQEQNVALGLVAADAPSDSGFDEHDDTTETTPAPLDDPNDEIYIFPGVCSSCGHPLDTKMKKVAIPYFKVQFPYDWCNHVSPVLSDRISSSCPPTASGVATGTTKSSQVERSLNKGSASHFAWKMGKTLAGTS
jgi:hypothetical protein